MTTAILNSGEPLSVCQASVSNPLPLRGRLRARPQTIGAGGCATAGNAAGSVLMAAYNASSSGVGTTVQLSAEALKLAAKIVLAHIPCKRKALAFADLACGKSARVKAMINLQCLAEISWSPAMKEKA